MSTRSTPVASDEEITSSSCPPPNLPCGDLLGNRDLYHEICVPLYNASMRGDWEAACIILEEHRGLDLLGFAITQNYDTALHIAVSVKSSKVMERFMEKLVNKMTKEQLILQNRDCKTALYLAARAAENVNIVMTMVEKNRDLMNIPSNYGLMPLNMALKSGQSEMVNFFYNNSDKMTGDFWTHHSRSRVFETCVEVDLFEVALKIVTDRPELVDNPRAVVSLAKNTEAFGFIKPPFIWRAIQQVSCMKIGPEEKPSHAMHLLRVIWTNIIKLPKPRFDDILRNIIYEDGYRMRCLPILFIAAQAGNTEFVVEIIRQFPDLILERNDEKQTIFHVAVLHRHEGIYNLLHEVGTSTKDFITSIVDDDGNNMLHLAARWANENDNKDNKCGIGLQIQHIQREVLWFKVLLYDQDF
ncbi:hypothetical protein L1887_01000 [Cichorium endivia]|nr:hypothetical protein L1887_01000 [Cichorium endivia]